MRKFFLSVYALLTMLTTPSAIATGDTVPNSHINTHYILLKKAFEQLDATLINNLYTENACYLPEGQSKKIIIGRDEIVNLHRKFFNRIRQKQANIEVDFRVINRKFANQKATDVGYFLIRIHPTADEGEPVTEFAGKFVSVLEQTDQNQWLLSVDSSHKADAKLYFSSEPIANLYYGTSFKPLSQSHVRK